MEKTLGERRVRTDFNVSGNDVVTLIKHKSAELIDLLQAMRNDEGTKTFGETPETKENVSGEKFRLIAIAQTKYEEAAMYAVKAATA